jgi:acyl carrier protein
MTRQEIEATVRGVLEEAFDRPIVPGEEVSQRTEAAWNSVKHIDIIFMLEEALGITFAEEEMTALVSLQGIVDRVSARVNGG